MKCLACNKEVRSINYVHLKYCSGLTVSEYKEKYSTSDLMDDDVKIACAHHGVDNSSWVAEKHNKSSWKRTCQCGRIVVHRSYEAYLRSKKINTCTKCIVRDHWIGKLHSVESKSRISLANKGKDYNKSRLGVRESEETRRRKSIALKGNKSWLGRKHSDSTRQKMSEARAKLLLQRFGEEHQISPWYNKTACALFETINKFFGWNGQHAENGGEFYIGGYWLDYYEPFQNIVIEFDEPRHDIPSVKEKDLIKQKYVTEQLKCKFIRIKQIEQDNWKATIQRELII